MRKLTEAQALAVLTSHYPDEQTRKLARDFAQREWHRRHGHIYDFEYEAAELVEAV